MTDLSQILKQAQGMQKKMKEMQAELELIEVEGQSGAGMVTVRLNGKGIMKSVKIDPSLFDREEAEVVEDLITAAHNDAKEKLESRIQEEMKSLTGGLSLPPGMKMPF